MSYHDKRLIWMEVADTIKQLGTCDRKHVGAVIIRDGRCISWGYNGAAPGMPHCDENQHGWQDEFARKYPAIGDMQSAAKLRKFGCINATHAEANALAFAAKQGISTDGAELYVTCSPCLVCARLIIAAGIVRVVWEEEYRERDGIELLERAGLVFAV